MVVGSVLNGDCYLTTQYKSINLINPNYWGDGTWGTGDANAPPDFGRDRNKAFFFETPSNTVL